MTSSPWKTIGFLFFLFFFVGLIGGYYGCGAGYCPNFIFKSVTSLSDTQMKSQLIAGKKTKKQVKTTIVAQKKDRTVQVKPPEPLYFAEQVPVNFLSQFKNISVSVVGANAADQHDLDLLALAAYPFRAMLPKINTVIFLHYTPDTIGQGVRAFVTEYGKVMNLIAPAAYFRKIPDGEWINVVRHEFFHVFHDQILSDTDRKLWDQLVFATGKVDQKLAFSEYGTYDNYEVLSEDAISLLLLSAEEVAAKRPDLKALYDFLSARFQVERFSDRRLRQTLPLDQTFPSGKDATKLTDYPLPQFTL